MGFHLDVGTWLHTLELQEYIPLFQQYQDVKVRLMPRSRLIKKIISEFVAQRLANELTSPIRILFCYSSPALLEPVWHRELIQTTWKLVLKN